ncbi:MAG: hypothetical protein KAY24_01205 [Candidatus Eisenbacteria sp.]|nr:hypothetical protein [Candidatus Eisenbacteria bacterium]
MKLRLMYDCEAGARGSVKDIATSEAKKLIRRGLAYDVLDEAAGRQIPYFAEEFQKPKKAKPKKADEPGGDSADESRGEVADEPGSIEHAAELANKKARAKALEKGGKKK